MIEVQSPDAKFATATGHFHLELTTTGGGSAGEVIVPAPNVGPMHPKQTKLGRADDSPLWVMNLKAVNLWRVKRLRDLAD